MNILLVDDEERNLKLLESMLASRQYGLIRSGDGASALKILREQDVDLVILDIMIPEMSGLEVLKTIRNDEKLKSLPVILVTALTEREDKIAGLKAGADDYVSKPFDREELLTRIDTQIHLSYLRRQMGEKQKFELIFNEMLDGIVVCNPDWTISDLNKAARKLLDIQGPDKPAFLDWIYSHFTMSVERSVFSQEPVSQVECEAIRPETKHFRALYLEIRVHTITGSSGGLLGRIVVLRDITDFRREAMMKQDFFGLVSHKLRTPLAIILGNATLLEDGTMGALTTDQTEVVSMIAQSSRLLRYLIDQLLKFKELNASKSAPPVVPINLQQYFAQDLVARVSVAKDRRVEVTVSCPDPAAEILIDPPAFDLIIENVLSNAVLFNDQETVCVNVAAHRSAEKTILEISDNGRGIPSESLDQIFQTFYQVDKYFTGQTRGIGLGLPLVQRLITDNGGTVQVQSEVGRGTRMIMTFPAVA